MCMDKKGLIPSVADIKIFWVIQISTIGTDDLDPYVAKCLDQWSS